MEVAVEGEGGGGGWRGWCRGGALEERAEEWVQGGRWRWRGGGGGTGRRLWRRVRWWWRGVWRWRGGVEEGRWAVEEGVGSGGAEASVEEV